MDSFNRSLFSLRIYQFIIRELFVFVLETLILNQSSIFKFRAGIREVESSSSNLQPQIFGFESSNLDLWSVNLEFESSVSNLMPVSVRVPLCESTFLVRVHAAIAVMIVMKYKSGTYSFEKLCFSYLNELKATPACTT